MELITILGLAVGLAMDAFAVSLVAGATIQSITYRHIFRLSWHFGLFQFFMPIIGWLMGMTVIRYVESIDHWIAFGLLAFIGIRMIWESFQAVEEYNPDFSRGWSLVVLSVATSIDALAVGLSLSILGVAILYPSFIIGITAGFFSVAGVFLGKKMGLLLGKRFGIIGGIILIFIGVRILVTHLLS